MILHWKMPFTFAAALGRAFVHLCRGNPVIAPVKIRLAREDKCAACPHRVSEMCSLCNCFIDLKVSLSSEECPDTPPQWKRLTIRKIRSTSQ